MEKLFNSQGYDPWVEISCVLLHTWSSLSFQRSYLFILPLLTCNQLSCHGEGFPHLCGIYITNVTFISYFLLIQFYNVDSIFFHKFKTEVLTEEEYSPDSRSYPQMISSFSLGIFWIWSLQLIKHLSDFLKPFLMPSLIFVVVVCEEGWNGVLIPT